MQVNGYTVGAVVRAGKMVSNDGKKPFASCTIENVREWNGKEFRSKVELITYRDVEDIVGRLNEGVIACGSGDVRIRKFEWQGKACASLQIVGDITVFNDTPSTPRQAAQTAPEVAEDDVPF